MSKLLLNLRNVPDDEADDVRAMLDAKRIAYYETPPSFWGVSSGGIWVTEDADFADAKRALDDYEQQRSARQISGRRRSRNVSRHGCLIPWPAKTVFHCFWSCETSIFTVTSVGEV